MPFINGTSINTIMLVRKTCPCCNLKPVAINYKKCGRTYYRKKCDQCYRKKRKPAPPAWLRSGYKKKDRCEKCNFRFKFAEQSHVYHLDGNTSNNDWFNLRTICANCAIEIEYSNLGWRPDSRPEKLKPDF